MNALRPILSDILLVWSFFTRIPAPPFRTGRKIGQALWALPLVGIVIAGAQILMSLLVALGIARFESAYTPLLIGFALTFVPLILTGALHWDGLADLFDGLGVGKDRRQGVMRDPRLGTFGALALLSAFTAQILLYAILFDNLDSPDFSLSLCLTAMLSRQTLACVWAAMPWKGAESQTVKGQPRILLTLIIWAALLGGGIGAGLLSFPLGLLFPFLMGAWALCLAQWLPTASGDGLGATQVLSETALLLLLILSL